MNDPFGQAIYDYYHSGKADLLLVDSNYTEGEEMDPAIFFRNSGEMPGFLRSKSGIVNPDP